MALQSWPERSAQIPAARLVTAANFKPPACSPELRWPDTPVTLPLMSGGPLDTNRRMKMPRQTPAKAKRKAAKKVRVVAKKAKAASASR